MAASCCGSGSTPSGALGLLVAFLLVVPPARGGDEILADFEPLFNWDLISLEQNNPRFNGSVLTGFHSVRSPGVTPYRGWKAGIGFMYTRERQISELTDSDLFDRDQLLVNPKLNYGFFTGLEAGAGLTGSYAVGRELVSVGGMLVDQREDNLDLSSVDLGIKWNLLDRRRYRLALAFDSRLAINPGDFGNLPGDFFNFEFDADFAITNRFSLVGNLQFLTSGSSAVESQFMGDIATTYSFTDQFRGMLLGTIQEDDEAGTALGFVGMAGQYVIQQHSFTLAFDLQINDAMRDIRTEEQLDVEFSYTFTFD